MTQERSEHGPASDNVVISPYTDDPDDRMLTFRTITSLIGVIQQHLRIGYAHDPKPTNLTPLLGSLHEKGLRMLSSLATLLVRDNEIVAVAAAHLRSSPLTLVACTSESERNPRNSEAEATSSQNHANHLLFPNGGHFITIRNPRNNDSCSTLMMLEPLPSAINMTDPIAYLCQNWHNQMFEEHTAQIMNFLNICQEKNSRNEGDGFMLDHSRTLFENIVELPMKDLKFRSTQSAPNKYDSHFLVAFKEYQGQSIRRAIIRDLDSSLESLDDPVKRRILQDMVRKQPHDADNLFPRLLKLASAYQPSRPQTIYTKKTYREFHQLLCLLLLGYRDSLQELMLLKKSQTPPPPEILYTRINISLNYLAVLHPLAHSKAIESYFSMVSTAIQSRHRHTAIPQDIEEWETDPDSDLEDLDGEEEEEDIDVPGVTPMVRRTPVAAEVYIRWIRLQMSYFDAATFILRTMREVPTTVPITIKIFYPPYTGRMMKPWRDVVLDVVSRIGLSNDDGTSDRQRQLDATSAINALEYLMTCPEYSAFGIALAKLSSGKDFKGRMHCEACMVILMFGIFCPKTFINGVNKLDRTAIGVSKRCCPVCTTLLQCLSHETYSSTGPIHVMGSHRTISPCTLPPWLPKDVIEEIVSSFERELGTVLSKAIELKSKKTDPIDDGPRKSTESTGSADSHPFSSDDRLEPPLDEAVHEPQIASRYPAWPPL